MRPSETGRSSAAPALSARELVLSASPLAAGSHQLELSSGEVCLLGGASGSGKTSLLRGLIGLLPYRSGSLLVSGSSLEELGAPEFRRRVQYVAQRPPRPVGEPGAFFRRVQEVRAAPESFQRTLEQRLQELDLDAQQLWHRSIAKLSEGEWHRAVIAAAFAGEPRVLLLDEPTAALDDPRARSLAEMTQRFCEQGGGVLWVSHQIPPGNLVAARVLSVRDGALHEESA